MAPKQGFTSDWQLECGQIRERAGRILKAQQWTDCSFLVGADAEQVEIKCHKLILAMASPVFEAMFYGLVAEGNGPIAIPDMQPVAFKALIEYIYTDNIVINSNTLACDLYYGAQKYMLPQLKTVCVAHLSSNITADMVCSIYEFALLVDERELAKDCEKVIQTKTEEVLKGSNFLEVQLDTVVKIFSMHPLCVESELVMIEAADQYNQVLENAKFVENSMDIKKVNFEFTLGTDKRSINMLPLVKEEENSVAGPAEDPFVGLTKPSVEKKLTPSSSNKEQKAECIKDEIGCRKILKVLQKIDFLTLTTQQIAQEKRLHSLLNTEELMAIMMNAASTNTYIPMPPGFSTSRKHRRLVSDFTNLWAPLSEKNTLPLKGFGSSKEEDNTNKLVPKAYMFKPMV